MIRSLFILLLLAAEKSDLNFYGDFTGITLLDLIEDFGFVTYNEGLVVALVKAFLPATVLCLEIVEGTFSRKMW